MRVIIRALSLRWGLRSRRRAPVTDEYTIDDFGGDVADIRLLFYIYRYCQRG